MYVLSVSCEAPVMCGGFFICRPVLFASVLITDVVDMRLFMRLMGKAIRVRSHV